MESAKAQCCVERAGAATYVLLLPVLVAAGFPDPTQTSSDTTIHPDAVTASDERRCEVSRDLQFPLWI